MLTFTVFLACSVSKEEIMLMLTLTLHMLTLTLHMLTLTHILWPGRESDLQTLGRSEVWRVFHQDYCLHVPTIH